MDVLSMNVTPQGFELTFTRPVNSNLAEKTANYQFSRYYYEYRQEYGSPRMDKQPVVVEELQISEDGKKVSIVLEDMVPGYVYDLQIDSLSSTEGVILQNRRLFYTLNNLPTTNTISKR